MKSSRITTTVLLLCIGFAAAFPVQAALNINSATWDGKKLVAQGTDGSGSTVNVYYGYDDPENSTLLGVASVKSNGRWKLATVKKRSTGMVSTQSWLMEAAATSCLLFSTRQS